MHLDYCFRKYIDTMTILLKRGDYIYYRYFKTLKHYYLQVSYM